jgi:hypothetical protein
MASEPVNIFAPSGDPDRILDEVRSRYPQATSDGRDWTWLRLELPQGALTLLHERDYYAGPGWPTQRRGMQGYFRRFPASDELHQRVDQLIGRFQFALATRFEPDYEDPSRDDRFAVVCGLTAMLGGVIFTPSGLRDAEGRYLIGAGGESDDDAEWPA